MKLIINWCFVFLINIFYFQSYGQENKINKWQNMETLSLESKVDSMNKEISELKQIVHQFISKNKTPQYFNYPVDTSLTPFNSTIDPFKTLIDTSDLFKRRLAEMQSNSTNYNPINEYRKQVANEKMWEGGTKLLLDLIFSPKSKR